MPRTLKPLHPGEVLREEFMEPFGLSSYKLAAECLIPRTRIERIVREEMGITADTALRLARYFGNSPEFWVRLQSNYDIETKLRGISGQLKRIKTRRIRTGAKAA
jgi:addiction module HigA family antidote